MDERGAGWRQVVSARIYIEGGGDSKDGRTRCREGFHKLLRKSGLSGRMPRLVASGSRGDAFDNFKASHSNASGPEYVALLIDSEGRVSDIEETWGHLRRSDGWQTPPGAQDDQVLLMTTCMETWIVADQAALREHFGREFRPNALPSATNLENRSTADVQSRLENATRGCAAPYAKGPRSYEVVGKLNPDTLESPLPSFGRARRILNNRLS